MSNQVKYRECDKRLGPSQLFDSQNKVASLFQNKNERHELDLFGQAYTKIGAT